MTRKLCWVTKIQNSFIEDSRREEEEIRSWPYKIRVVFFKLIMKALPKSFLTTGGKQ